MSQNFTSTEYPQRQININANKILIHINSHTKNIHKPYIKQILLPYTVLHSSRLFIRCVITKILHVIYLIAAGVMAGEGGVGRDVTGRAMVSLKQIQKLCQSPRMSRQSHTSDTLTPTRESLEASEGCMGEVVRRAPQGITTIKADVVEQCGQRLVYTGRFPSFYFRQVFCLLL